VVVSVLIKGILFIKPVNKNNPYGIEVVHHSNFEISMPSSPCASHKGVHIVLMAVDPG